LSVKSKIAQIKQFIIFLLTEDHMNKFDARNVKNDENFVEIFKFVILRLK